MAARPVERWARFRHACQPAPSHLRTGPYTGAMAQRRRGRVVAAVLSMLLPGAGQLYVGATRRGAVLIGATLALGIAAVALAATRPFDLADSAVSRGALWTLLAVDIALLAFRLFAIVDAWRWGRGAASLVAVTALGAMVALTAAPHVAAGYVAVRGYDVLDDVFAEEEPADVLAAESGVFLRAPLPPRALPHRDVDVLEPALSRPARAVPFQGRSAPLDDTGRVVLGATKRLDRPWVTLLLMGSDRGPGNWGERTDTMIVAAIQRSTGRAVAFGVPRNYVGVPLGGVAGRSIKRFWQPLNALYSFGNAHPALFPGGDDAGGTAAKQTLSRLLGIRIDYFALVDLLGFADLVDALGGVDIRVNERIVDEVTRPAWGEPKPTIDVQPGRTYHFFGREALAYVRSRKASSDYTRMTRQRCFLTAMARQADVVSVLRNFGSLADTVEASVRTDIPLARLPDLLRLARGIDPKQTLTETFDVDYIARRRASDRFPIPNARRIRTTVREAILSPGRSGATRGIASADAAC
jgi:LCP family protein required for cell wall assembly